MKTQLLFPGFPKKNKTRESRKLLIHTRI